MAFLVDEYIQRHCDDPRYDVAHTKVIEDTHTMEILSTYLQETIPALKETDTIKVALKIIEGNGYAGVHFIPFYLRKENGMINIFIFDAVGGISFDLRGDFGKLTETLYQAASQMGPVKIFKTSSLIQADWRSCSMFTLKALKFFIKHGSSLFSQLGESDCVPQTEKASDEKRDYVVHLKVGSLPARLAKFAQRQSYEKMNTVYQTVLPLKKPLPSIYFNPANGQPFFYQAQDHIVSQSKGKKVSLNDYLQQHIRKTEKGDWNYAAIDLMNKQRGRIRKIMIERQIINEENELNLTILDSQLDLLKKRVLTC